MTTPALFQYNDHVVRTVTVDGDPWFVAADVCAVLDLADPSSAVRALDDDERGLHAVLTPGGDQRVVVVSEAGLYALTWRSRKPEAKSFKRWITHEVLPAIRRNGSYAVVPQTYAQALRAAADAVEARELAEQQLEITAPKAASYDRVIESEGMYDMTGIADMCRTSVNKFTGWLADLGIFRKGEYDPFPGRRLPRKRHLDDGLFVVRIETNGKGIHYPVAYATPTGLAFVLEELRASGLID